MDLEGCAAALKRAAAGVQAFYWEMEERGIDVMSGTVDPHSGLDVRFLARILEFEKDLESEGIRAAMVSGFRSVGAQDKLYAQGRTKPGRIVTNARGGESYHNFGLAADYVMQPHAALFDRECWCRFGACAQKHNLVWGGAWAKVRDWGHVQYPGHLLRRKRAG